MPPASYLRPLVAPLRFLAQSDFARLSTVKGLDALVRTALQGAREAESGGDVQLLERVARALAHGGAESQEALRALAPRVREAEAAAEAPRGTPAARKAPENGRPTRGRGSESVAVESAAPKGRSALAPSGPGRVESTGEASVAVGRKGAEEGSPRSGPRSPALAPSLSGPTPGVSSGASPP